MYTTLVLLTENVSALSQTAALDAASNSAYDTLVFWYLFLELHHSSKSQSNR
jgi:hypothetical protein